ncbi:PHB depolymerase family esterase [Sphingobium sufflavum]|uniref:extracellular catalytic domain type 1 short-chain-length polyhydroxyalkanoate depolymerase n=1 Tax=Sphingobium sufflavum TaxID=1129547 RepID=UPI001F1BBF54|nr:PHB depolymerase family esterase [Sphingobium sufflavum]MCE7796218.1 PHB depolymerase family esterase [Sphingobium sufflavum]
MADFITSFLKATRLARRRRPLSAAFALGDGLASLGKPKAKSRRKPAAKAPAQLKPQLKPRSKPAAARPIRPKKPPGIAKRPAPGSFTSDELACPQGLVRYRLYVPRGSARQRLPLVVMLHGCSQSAEDFAAGTDMNRLADELGIVILYPQQSQAANLARCWNWHDPDNQARGRGEPAMIAALTRHAIALTRANPARIYIAGLSAGGAAAAIVGAAYPDLYVAVGVHSGVARGDIRSLGAALSAMRGRAGPRPTGGLPRPLPTIVFHGDSDRVVHPSNAGGFLSNLERSRAGPLLSQSISGRSEGGRDFTRKLYRTGTGQVLLEDWTIHGSGHSWSGGRATGSHTDPAGPSASREMLRFFLSYRRGA